MLKTRRNPVYSSNALIRAANMATLDILRKDEPHSCINNLAKYI